MGSPTVTQQRPSTFSKAVNPYLSAPMSSDMEDRRNAPPPPDHNMAMNWILGGGADLGNVWNSIKDHSWFSSPSPSAPAPAPVDMSFYNPANDASRKNLPRGLPPAFIPMQMTDPRGVSVSINNQDDFNRATKLGYKKAIPTTGK